MSVKKFLVNLACGFIPSKSVRHRVRVRAQFDIKSYVDFAVRDAGLVRPTVRTYQGHNGMKKIIVVLNNTVAYKFPLVDARADSPRREKMFADAFRNVSPVRLPKMELLQFRGMDVLKYEFITGQTLATMRARDVRRHADKIASQLAAFIYQIGMSDPVKLKSLKPRGAKPGFMFGWYHGDIGGNFIVNPETGDIAAFIDWETAGFCDWTNDIMAAYRFMSKRGFGDVMMRTVLEYGHLYATGQVKKGK